MYYAGMIICVTGPILNAVLVNPRQLTGGICVYAGCCIRGRSAGG